MITKEQVAHDLAIVYLNNRYGITVGGSFDYSCGIGTGSVSTEHAPVSVCVGQDGTASINPKADKWLESIYIEYVNAYHIFMMHQSKKIPE